VQHDRGKPGLPLVSGAVPGPHRPARPGQAGTPQLQHDAAPGQRPGEGSAPGAASVFSQAVQSAIHRSANRSVIGRISAEDTNWFPRWWQKNPWIPCPYCSRGCARSAAPDRCSGSPASRDRAGPARQYAVASSWAPAGARPATATRPLRARMNSHIVNCLEPQPGSLRTPQPERACLVGLGRSPVSHSSRLTRAHLSSTPVARLKIPQQEYSLSY